MNLVADDHCVALRIIAGETRLTDSDRAALREAADQLEFAQRDLVSTYAKLIETQQRLIAVNEQLIEERKARLPAMPVTWSMSTGWVKCR